MSTGGYFGFTPAAAQLSTAVVAAASAAYPPGPAAVGQQPNAPTAAAYAAIPTYSASAGGYTYAAAIPAVGVGVPQGAATYPYAVAAAQVTRPATSSIGNYTYSSAGYSTGSVAATGYFGPGGTHHGAALAGPPPPAGTGMAAVAHHHVAGGSATCCTPGMGGMVAPGYCSSLSYSTGLTPAIQTMTPAVRVTPAVKVTPVTGYDAALYAAATNYLQQTQTAQMVGPPCAFVPGGTHSSVVVSSQQVPTIHLTNSPVVHAPAQGAVVHIQPASISVGRGRAGMGFTGGGQRHPHHHNRRPGGAGLYTNNRPPQQVHYCEVCKISCAGPMTYKEHLDGQKHKKKEQQLKDGDSKQTLPLTKTSYRCDLCGVTCTGKDTYNAHVKGAKHVKTVKLHQSLGKPMPSLEPTVIPAQFPSRSSTSSGKSDVGSSYLAELDDVDDEKDIAPVGEDYIEVLSSPAVETGGTNSGQVTHGGGKVITYHCKLCDCTFNDQNAKDMHLKGRRHRLQYKKKVNPDLEVEMKMTAKQRFHHDRMMRREMMSYRGADMYGGSMFGGPPRGHPMYYGGPGPRGGPPIPLFMQQGGPPPHGMRMQFSSNMGGFGFDGPRPESADDKSVMQRHKQIYPSDDELEAVQKVVNNTEKALKSVSDHFNEHKNDETIPNPKKDTEVSKVKPSSEPDERLLKGVMRVGNLAKGLLLTKDLNVKLVILCSQKPTMALLYKIYELLPKYYEGITKEKYELNVSPQNGYIKVCNTGEQPRVTMILHVTSGMMRDGPGSAVGADGAAVPDPPDILDKTRCLEALAWLRHAKWFQARCSNLSSCLILLRVMRDLCNRIPTWSPLTSWVLELLTEKILCSANGPLSPGEGFRRMFEAVSSGILLPTGPGLVDPCERDSKDALDALGVQQREDITASAQHAIRLIAFGNIHKVLGGEKAAKPATKQVLGKRSLAAATGKSDSSKKIKEEEA